MNARIYVEGGATGPHSNELTIRCREAFRKLLEKRYQGRLPKVIPRGSRDAAFDDFKTALKSRSAGEYVALWIDSEEPLADLENTWQHLKRRDGWDRPVGTDDKQVLFMTTCMETLIVADRKALQAHYGHELQKSALPPLVDLEKRGRHDVQGDLAHATRNCTNAYAKGKRSFEILAKLDPQTLEERLPSFARTRRILDAEL